MNRHALVIGKFYPPHEGHHRLIEAAQQHAVNVSVVVMASAAENLPLADRVAWLRAEHPATNIHGIRCDAPLDLHDREVWAAQIALMRAATRKTMQEPVDLVVTGGDSYGPELAARFSASLLIVDRPPDAPSGTTIRASLAQNWPSLRSSIRSGLATRVVFVGGESTGTTCISQTVAGHYRKLWTQTQWVPEYGREYTLSKWDALNKSVALEDMVWAAEDFDRVAAEQTRRENQAAGITSPLLLCDTDALATVIWEQRYLGLSARIHPAYAIDLPRRDLYFVTDHVDVPWNDDGLREGDLAIRAAMTTWFEDLLTERKQSWVLLTGTEQQRVNLAIRTIDQLLERRMHFTAPFSGPGFGR